MLQIQAATDGLVLGERKIDRAGKDVLNAAIFRGSYPKDVLIIAEPRFGASGCTDPLYPNGRGAQQAASFPDKSFIDLTLALAGPAPANDLDGDGYAGEASGGPDCNDGDPNVYPGATESCTGGIDSNCNRLLGCAEPACFGQTCSEPPASIAFISAPQALTAGICSGATTIETRDATNNPKVVAGNTGINLTGPASMKFYSDSLCTIEVTGIVVPTGASEQSFYFSATAAGTAIITATLPGITPTTQTQTINPSNAMALALLGTPQTVVAGTCSAAVTLQTQDTYGNASAPAAALPISLSETGPSGFTFYSDPGCTAAITSLTLAAGSSSASFHFMGLRDGVAQILASAAGFTSASQDETIAKGAPAALAFTTSPQSVTVSACSTVTSFRIEDAAGNPVDAAGRVVTLSATNGLQFYSDAACTTPAFTVSSAADGTGSFYFLGNTPGPADITLSSTGLSSALQSESIVSAGPTLLAFVGAPSQATAGACSGPIQVEARDSFGTALPVSTATTVNLAAIPAPGFGFYADSSCTTPISLVTIAAGASQSGNLYLAGTAAGSVTFTGTPSPAGLTAASHTLSVQAATAASIQFTSAAQTVAAGQCSGVVALRARDTYGNTATLGAAADVGLSASAPSGFSFFPSSDPTCGGAPVTVATIAAGQGTTTFYFKASQVGSVTVTADATAAGLGTATQVETVGADAPSKLAFTSAAQVRSAGECSAVVNVQAQDAYGNSSAVTAGAFVGLAASPPAGVTFWSDNICSSPLTQIQIAPGASDASPFYFMATVPGTVTLTASSAPLTPATQNEQINNAPASALAFTTAPQTVTAGQCSAAATVQTRDAYGNPADVTAALTLSLAASPAAGFTFYSDAGCTAPTTTATVAAGANTSTFWFKANRAVTETVSVSGASVGSASQNETVNPGAAAALRITTAAQNLTAGVCSAPVDFQTEDALGNQAAVTSVTDVGLSGTLGLTFYSDAGCTAAVTSVSLAIGQATGGFYFIGTNPGSPVVTLTAPGLTSTTQTETITVGVPTTLVFLSPPANLAAGACSAAIQVESRDGFGTPSNVTVNTTVSLAAAPGTSFGFYSSSSCTAPITQVTIPSGTSQSGNFYIKGTASGAQDLTGTYGTLNPATATVTIAPGPPSAISYTSTSQTVVAGACSGAVTLRSADTYGNDSPVTANTLVTLVPTPSAGVTFYNVAGCGGGAVTQAVFLAGQFTATFYFRAQGSGSLSILADATAASMGTATQTETVLTDVPDRLAFTSASQTRTANVCSAAVNVQVQDQFGNPSAVAAATLVNLAANPATGFGFFSDPTCTTAVAQVSIAAGAYGAAPFYFKSTRSGAVDVTVSSGALTPATQAEQIDPAAASVIAFLTPPQTVTAGACSAVTTVQTRDTYGNVANVGADLTVNLAAAPSTGFGFYSDPACTSSVTSTTVLAGSATGSFYFKGDPAGSVVVTASGAAMTSATQTETIQAGPATVLNFTSAPQTVTAGACSLVTNFRTEDGSGNPVNVSSPTTVSITGPGSVTYYSDSTCTASITGVTLAAGTGTGSFYFKGTMAGSVAITLSATGFTPATQNESIQAAGPTMLVFLSPPPSEVAGACSPAMRVESQDSFGSAAAVTANTVVSLSASPAAGFAFYSNNTCATLITSVTISNGFSQSPQLYIRGTAAGPVNLTGTPTSGMTGLTPATAAVSIAPAAPSAIEFTTAPQSIDAGACSAVATVRARDAFSNTSPVGAATTVLLSASPSTGFTFYSDAGCATPVTSAIIAAGTGTTSFYFKGTGAGAVTVTADATGASLSTTTQTETILAGTPDRLAFTSAPQTRSAGQCSAAVDVQSQDQWGNASNVTVATIVTLSASPSSGFDFYSDAGCTTPISQVAIALGSANATPFYFMGTVMGGVTVTASNVSFNPGTQVEQINPATPSVLVFETAPQTRTAGQCSSLATLRTHDAFGNIANVAANLTVSLSAAPSTGFAFYSDAGCTTAVTTVTVASGTSTAGFYFKGTAAGAVTVTAAAGGYTSAVQVETIQPDAANKLAFTSSPQTVVAGSCSAVADFESEDTYGNRSNVTANTTVNITGTAGLTFYSDAACTSSITSVLIPNGTATGQLYFKGTTAGTATITLTAAPLVSATQDETISPAPATVLAFLNPPAAQAAGACSAAVRVESRDLFGTPTNVTSATIVGLTASPAAGFGFYSDNTCATAIATVTIANGTSQSPQFYVRGTAVGPVVMTGAAATFTSATATVQIDPATPVGIEFTSAPQALVAGSCSAVASLRTLDSYGNTSPVTSAATVNLSATPGAGFTLYSDAGCVTPVTSVQVLVGQATASFYFRGTWAGTVSVLADAASASLGTASQSETIGAAAAFQLGFTSASQTRDAGQCSAAVNVESQDTYGNTANVASATAVDLTAAPSAGFGFYSDATCTTAITQASIAAGTSSATPFYFKGTTMGAVNVTAAAAGLTSASQTEQINSAVASVLLFETTPQTRTAGTCSAVATLRTQDAYGNFANVASDLSVGLAAAPAAGFTFYSDATCTTAVASITVAAGTSAASFYFMGTAAGTVMVTASAAGFTSATQTETIQPAVAFKLAFTSSAQTIVAGDCSAAANFESEDNYGNRSNVTANTTVNISGTAGLTFYSDGGCTSSIASVVIPIGTATGQLYFKGTVAGSATITLTAAGLASGTQTETIQPAPATVLAFLNAPASQLAGACSPAMQVESRDMYGSPSNVTADTGVALTAAPSTGFGFYSDNTCATAIGTVTIASGTSQSPQFYVRGTASGPVALLGAAAGFTSATASVTIDPEAPIAIAFTSAPQTVVAGTCSAATDLRVVDTYGNASPVAAATTVNLSATPSTGFTFYSDVTCTTPATSTLVAAGASTSTFYFVGTVVGTPTITADATAASLGTDTQIETITPAAVNKLVFTGSAQSLAAGACSTVVDVQSQDQYGNPANVAAATLVDLTAAPPAGFTFYSDATCTTAITQVTIAAGSSAAAPFYFTGNSAGSVTVTAAATGLTSGTQTEMIVPGSPSVLVFETVGQTQTAGQCSGIATVGTRDSFGNTATVSSALTVDLAAVPATNFLFYSDATCTTLATSTTVAAGASTASFWFRGTTAGTFAVTASATGYTPATQNETITGDVPNKLAFTSSAQTVVAGLCSATTDFEVEDTWGNPVNVTVATTVTLGGPPSVTFYSDSTCTTGISDVSLAVGQGAGSFFFKGTSTGTQTLTLAAPGLTGASQDETITSPGPFKLVFVSVPGSIVAGACSAAANVEVQDQFSSPANVSGDTDVILTGTATAQFFSDATCTTPIATIRVSNGQSLSAPFYFTATQAGTATLTAAYTGLVSGTADVSVTGAAANGIMWTTLPQTAMAGTCSGAVTVAAKDQYGNITTVPVDTNVALSAAPATLAFYTDASCSTAAVTQVTILTGTQSATFYFTGTVAGSPVVTADAGALGLITQTQTVTANSAAGLAFASLPQTQTAGQCSAVVDIQSQDTYGNPANVTADEVVTLSAAPAAGFTFYSDSACTTPITDVTILTGTQAASFYFTGTAAGTVSATVTGATLTAASQTETIVAGPQTQLAIITSAHSLTAGVCSATPLTIQAQDTFGNPTTVVSDVTVNLGHSLAIPGDFTFYATVGCGASITSTTITAGTSSASVYLTGIRAGPVDVTASATGFTSATQQQIVAAAAPSQVVILGTSQSVGVDQCSNVVTVQSQDAYGNPSVVSANTTVNLSATGGVGGVTMHDTAACSGGGISSVVIASGTMTATFYFKANAVQTFTLVASVTGWSPDGTQVETIVVPAAPTQIVIITPARTQTADTSCSAVVTVQSQDGASTPSNVTADTVVNLTSSAASQWTFYSDATCTTPVTSVTIANGTNSQDFYFTGRVAETVTVTATTVSLGNTTQDEVITAGAPSVLKFTSAAMNLTAGVCSASPVTVQTQDAYGNPSDVTGSPLTVNLTSDNPNLRFYTDGTCATELASITILVGTNSGSFNILGTQRASVIITAAAAGYTSDTQTEIVDAAAGDHLAFATSPQTVGMNACSGITTIEARDVYENPISTAVTVTLSATAGFGAMFYSDAACTISIGSTLDIPVGPGAASFYFMATASGTMTITATATGLTQATQDETIGELVRKGTCAMTTAASTCTISPALTNAALDTDILFFQAINDTTSASAGNSGVSCSISSTTQISCERGNSQGNVSINWYVVEFPPTSGVQVRRISTPCTTTPIAVSPAVNASESFVLVSTTGNGNATNRSVFKQATLSAAGDSVTLSYCSGTENVALQVVDFPGAVVDRGTASMTAPGTTAQVTGLPVAAAGSTFLLYSYDISIAGTPICSRMVRGWMADTTSIDFSRGDGGACTITGDVNIQYERVRLPVGTVQQMETTMADTVTAGTASLTAVDLSRTTAFAGGQTSSGQATGETSATDQNFSNARALQTLSSNVLLQSDRAVGAGTARFTSYVVEWVAP